MMRRILILSITGLSFALADGKEDYKNIRILKVEPVCEFIAPDSIKNLIGKLEMTQERTQFFDETGLVIEDVKYFIRIWKHPDRRFFNMPNPFLPSVRKRIFIHPPKNK